LSIGAGSSPLIEAHSIYGIPRFSGRLPAKQGRYLLLDRAGQARLVLLERCVRKALTECIDKRGALIAEFERDQTAIRVHRLATPATPAALHSSPPRSRARRAHPPSNWKRFSSRMLSGGCKGPHSANDQGQSNPGRNKLRSDRRTRSPLSHQWKASNQRPNRGPNRALRADICAQNP